MQVFILVSLLNYSLVLGLEKVSLESWVVFLAWSWYPWLDLALELHSVCCSWSWEDKFLIQVFVLFLIFLTLEFGLCLELWFMYLVLRRPVFIPGPRLSPGTTESWSWERKIWIQVLSPVLALGTPDSWFWSRSRKFWIQVLSPGLALGTPDSWFLSRSWERKFWIQVLSPGLDFRTVPDSWFWSWSWERKFWIQICRIFFLCVCMLGGSECSNSSSAADVRVHRFSGIVSRRGEFLRSPGLQLLHADQDHYPAVAVRGRRFHWVGHHNTSHAISQPFSHLPSLTNPLQDVTEIVTIIRKGRR